MRDADIVVDENAAVVAVDVGARRRAPARCTTRTAADAQVVRAGWVPLRFVYEHIVGDPAGLCAIVEETRTMRLLQLRRVA
jgi:hypothetical protein